MIAPVYASIPPTKYGGTEYIIYILTEGLVKRGHKVTLFASGDSKTSAKLVSVCPRALKYGKLRDKIPEEDNNLYLLLNIAEALKTADNYDIIHDHNYYNTHFFESFIKKPIIHTLHLELPAKDKFPQRYNILIKYRKSHFVSISNSQRTIPQLNYVKTIYNGIDVKKFPFNKNPKDYLIWVGKICKIKGTAEAIRVAKKTGKKLLLIGKIFEKEYFMNKIKPHIDGKKILYLGEMNRYKAANYVKNAIALLNPINWSEPFGLVMIESMACGTPVIAFNRGSVPELIVDGKTGFIVNNVNQMAKAVKKVDKINRTDCRDHVEKKFNVEKMVDEYIEVYKQILKSHNSFK